MSLPAGSVKGAGDETGNVGLLRELLLRPAQLQVTATSPAVGSVLTAPVTDLVVQFNKAFDPYSINTSDFRSARARVVSAVPLTSSVDRPDALRSHPGRLADPDRPGRGDPRHRSGFRTSAFSRHLHRRYRVGTLSHAAPGQEPAGSLIYDPSVTGAVSFAGDTDTYTLPLAASQTLTLVLTTDPSLIGTLTLLDPTEYAIASATGGSAGPDVVLETAPVTTAGTYSLVVGGSGGTTGSYTLQAILNAVFKQPTDTNNSIGIGLRPEQRAFASLGTTPAADRAGVMGTIDPSGDSDFYKFYLNAGQSHARWPHQGHQRRCRPRLCWIGPGISWPFPSGASLDQSINLGGGFSGANGMTLNGFANISGSNLDLTDGSFSEAGSAFTTTRSMSADFADELRFSGHVRPSTSAGRRLHLHDPGEQSDCTRVRWRRPRATAGSAKRRRSIRLL